MTFKQNFIIFNNSLLKRFFCFSGRSRRLEMLYMYVWHVLSLFCVDFIIIFEDDITSNNYSLITAVNIVIFLTTTQLLAVTCRRLHDINFNSLWLFFGLLIIFVATSFTLPSFRIMPFIQFLMFYTTAFPHLLVFPGVILIAILFFKKGMPGSNKYGEPPIN